MLRRASSGSWRPAPPADRGRGSPSISAAVAQVVALAVRPHAPRVDHQKAGPPARAHAVAPPPRPAAKNVGSASSQLPRAQAERLAARLDVAADGVARVGVVCAMRLFSTTNSIGTSQIDARFIALVQQALAERAVADDHRDDAPSLRAACVARAWPTPMAVMPALHAVAVEVPVGEVLAAAAPPQTPPCRPMISATRPRKSPE